MKYILIALLFISCNNNNAKVINDCQTKVDSLQSELFISNTQVGRYEIALEMLKEEDSAAANKFENILYTKTE